MTATATVLPTSSPDPYRLRGTARTRPAIRSIEDQHQLIVMFRHLPAYWARRLYRAGLIDLWFFDDAIGYGQLSLVRAARIWDEDREIKFITYASASIKRRILRDFHWKRKDKTIPFSVLDAQEYRRREDKRSTDIPDHRSAGETPAHRRDENEAILDRYAASVTPYQRSILRLHYLEGYTISEVAALLKKSATAINWTLYDTLRRVRLDLGVQKKRPT